MTAPTPPPAPPENDDRPALDIDWVKTAAGALAAVTAAVLLSTLGAAGTLIGAAVGSVAATVGSAVYAQGLARSREVVRKAGTTGVTGLHRVTSVAQAGGDGGPQHEDDVRPGLGDRLRALPWKKIALLAAATFVVAMLLITGFEKATGRSVSQVTGGSSGSSGSTVPGVNRSDDNGGNDRDGQRDGNGGGQDGDDEDAPTDDATPTADPTPTATTSGTPTPSTSATPTPSATPTTTPTPSATPTPTSTPTTSARPTSPAASPTR